MHLLIEVFPGSLGIKEQTLIAQPVLTLEQPTVSFDTAWVKLLE